MQFNMTNGPVTTWDLVSDSYLYGRRPATYDHMTATHPSIYDDFDAIMAAAHLLSVDGAGYALDGAAWDAAYDYYGHDTAGVTYADEVIARAIPMRTDRVRPRLPPHRSTSSLTAPLRSPAQTLPGGRPCAHWLATHGRSSTSLSRTGRPRRFWMVPPGWESGAGHRPRATSRQHGTLACA